MDVVILAAGMGSRLGSQSVLLPKCLVPVGGTPLLHRCLRQLAGCGFCRVVIVTGHLSERVRSALSVNSAGLTVTTVQNGSYADTGTAASLCCAAPYVRSEFFLLLEGDLLFTSDFLVEARRRSRWPAILAADLSGSGDEVFVVTGLDGHLKELAKKPGSASQKELMAGTARICGELAGISVLPRTFIDYLVSKTSRDPSCRRRDYESFIVEYSSKDPIKVHWLKGAPWTEIDTPRDLDRAHSIVLPLLKKQEGTERYGGTIPSNLE